MPLQGSTSDRIRELHSGKTYKRSLKRFGKKKANKQSIAIALDSQRREGKRKSSRKARRKRIRNKRRTKRRNARR